MKKNILQVNARSNHATLIRWQFILVCIVSLLVTFYCQRETIFNQYAFNSDLRYNIFWMERARHPQIFRNSLLADFSDFLSNPLLKWLYKILFFIDIKILASLLSFPLCLISAIYIYKLGNIIAGSYCGLFTGIIFIFSAWYHSSFDFFGIGNAGDFFAPLGIIFLHYFYTENIFAVLLILILQAIIYPPIFLISLLCCIISFFSSSEFKKFLFVFFIIILTLSFLFNNYKKMQIKKFGDVYTTQEIKNMDEFKEGGKIPLIYPTLFKRIFNNRSGIGNLTGRLGVLLVLALTSIFIYFKKVRYLFPYKIGIFLFSSSLLFILANIFMLKLFEPSRYMLLSLPLVLILNTSIFISKIINRFKVGSKKIFASVVIIILIFFLFSKKISPDYELIENLDFFNYLKKLPSESLLAGHPDLMNDVLLIAKKNVFLTSKASQPYFKKYYMEIKRRTNDFFSAYYSDSFENVVNFCKKNSIIYFIIKKEHFSKEYLEQGTFYFAPYNDLIKSLTKKRFIFFLTKIPSHFISYEDKEYIVIKVD